MAKLRRKKRKKKEQGSHSVLISSFTRLKSVDFNLIYVQCIDTSVEGLDGIIKYRLRLIFIKWLSIYEQFKLENGEWNAWRAYIDNANFIYS